MTRDEAIALYGRVFRKRHGIGPVTPPPEIVIDAIIEAGSHGCMWALDGGGNLYRRYREPACNSPESPDGSQEQKP